MPHICTGPETRGVQTEDGEVHTQITARQPGAVRAVPGRFREDRPCMGTGSHFAE